MRFKSKTKTERSKSKTQNFKTNTKTLKTGSRDTRGLQTSQEQVSNLRIPTRKAKIPLRRIPRNFPVTLGEFTGKSATCHGEVADTDHETGKTRGSFGASNHRDMSRWFEKSRDKSATATSPCASF